MSLRAGDELMGPAREAFGPDWPAPRASMQAAADFLRSALGLGPLVATHGSRHATRPAPAEQQAARRIVVVPDKDADGLSAGAVLVRALRALQRDEQHPDAPQAEISVAHLSKGENVHQPHVGARLAALRPSHLVLLDMGSRGGPPVLPGVPTLVVDHHQPQGDPAGERGWQRAQQARQQARQQQGPHGLHGLQGRPGQQEGGAEGEGVEGGGALGEQEPGAPAVGEWGFPHGATALSAFGRPPVATSSLLTWCLVAQLHPPSAAPTAWLAVLGVLGDLGERGLPPFRLPALLDAHRAGRKTHFADAVALINAARRSPACDVSSAWDALCAASAPADIARGAAVPGAAALAAARRALGEELQRVGRTAPRFSADRALALLPLDSAWQVHPLLPQRWAGRLAKQDRSGALKAVLCSNRGYLPGRVHFSMRRAHPDPACDLIALLHAAVADRCAHPALAATPLAGLPGRLGADSARGHPEATGGMLPAAEFAQLMLVLGFTADVACGAAGLSPSAAPAAPAPAAAPAATPLPPTAGGEGAEHGPHAPEQEQQQQQQLELEQEPEDGGAAAGAASSGSSRGGAAAPAQPASGAPMSYDDMARAVSAAWFGGAGGGGKGARSSGSSGGGGRAKRKGAEEVDPRQTKISAFFAGGKGSKGGKGGKGGRAGSSEAAELEAGA